MKADEPRSEPETFADAARRLLAGLNERAKNRPGAESAPQIQIDRTCPSLPVDKGRESGGGITLSRPVIVAGSGGSGNGTVAANSNEPQGAVVPYDERQGMGGSRVGWLGEKFGCVKGAVLSHSHNIDRLPAPGDDAARNRGLDIRPRVLK